MTSLQVSTTSMTSSSTSVVAVTKKAPSPATFSSSPLLLAAATTPSCPPRRRLRRRRTRPRRGGRRPSFCCGALLMLPLLPASFLLALLLSAAPRTASSFRCLRRPPLLLPPARRRRQPGPASRTAAGADGQWGHRIANSATTTTTTPAPVVGLAAAAGAGGGDSPPPPPPPSDSAGGTGIDASAGDVALMMSDVEASSPPGWDGSSSSGPAVTGGLASEAAEVRAGDASMNSLIEGAASSSSSPSPLSSSLSSSSSSSLEGASPPNAALQQDFIYDNDAHGASFFGAPVEATTSPISASASARSRDELLSRRSAFRYGAALMSAALLTTVTLTVNQNAFLQPPHDEVEVPSAYRTSLLPRPILKDLATASRRGSGASSSSPPTSSSPQGQYPTAATKSSPSASKGSTTADIGRIEPVNFTRVASETNINLRMECSSGCISVDSKNFTKVQYAKRSTYPRWFPSSWIPQQPQVIKEIANSELLVASTVAGATTEMARTGLLYPLQTIKTRVQSDPHNFTRRVPPLREQVAALATNVKQRVQEGNLYAGISPTLLVSVPATGVYYGVRDVTKRMLLAMTPLTDTEAILAGALVGDVVSLCFRTPADTLAVRLQAQNETVGDWLGDSLSRLPMVIATDLPYLLSKIALNRLFIQGSLSVDRYAEFAIFTAVIAAFLTTPFDVARTRILLDKDLILDDDYADEHANYDLQPEVGGEVGGSAAVRKGASPPQGVFMAMLHISREGEGGIQNLYAGWLERVLYLGIGRAWLEPIQLVGYIGIRDAILLEWF